jgi:SAM-dependent methyltransferase
MDEPDLQTGRPHPARVYDYLLGGHTNFPADRAAAEQGIKANPASRTPVLQNRAFLRRAVHFLAAERGIDQFLDIGSGIPSAPNVHHVAQEVNPAARVVYVDNDPIVLAHARPLLTDGTDYLQADLRDVDAILGAPQLRATLDLDRPVGLLLIAILHFLGDADDPEAIVTRLLAALPPGSHLVLSHLTGDFAPEAWEHVAAIYRRTGVTLQVRSRERIAGFLTGLEPVDPGLVLVNRWRPEGEAGGRPTDAEVSVYGGVARKPVTS